MPGFAALSAGEAVIWAVPAFVLLTGALIVGASRRRDTGSAVGLLSRDTRRSDRGGLPLGRGTAGAITGREVERAATLEQRRGSMAVSVLEHEAPVAWVPPDPDVLGVTRRQFFNRSILVMFLLGLSGFGASLLAFLWPKLGGGFGAVVNVGSTQSVDTKIDDGDGFAYYPEGRMWISHYPAAAVGAARAAYSDAELVGMEAGYTALYQKCPHLGCRVPQCLTSQWFECQCHGSQYNRNGEKKGGPAPRGMDRFPMTFSGGSISVDTGTIIQGPPIGTNTTGQEAEGPHCVTGAGE